MMRAISARRKTLCDICVATCVIILIFAGSGGCGKEDSDKQSKQGANVTTHTYLLGGITHTVTLPEDLGGGGAAMDKEGKTVEYSREQVEGIYLGCHAYGWHRCLSDAKAGREFQKTSFLQGFSFQTSGDFNGYSQCQAAIEELKKHHDNATVAKMIAAALKKWEKRGQGN